MALYLLMNPFVFRLTKSFAQEVDLVIRVAGEVDSISNELRLVQSSMELVEDMKDPGEDEVTWAREAELTLSKVENVVDIFQSKRARYLRRGALKRKILRLSLLCDNVKLRNKVRKIKDQIQDLSNRRPVQLSNPPDLLAFSPEVQATYHSASIVVSSAMNEISLCLSQKLLMNRQVRKIVEDTRNEFERLHRSILVDLKGETCVDERARAWTDQVKDISHFTYDTFSSFINKMKSKNAFLVLEEDRIGKIIQVIMSRVLGLYKRKWIFGIGYVETNSTSMVSVVSRLSPGYSPVSGLYSLPYATIIAFYVSWLWPFGPSCTVFAAEVYFLEALLTQLSTKHLEWIKGDLSLVEALLKDVGGIEESLDKRLAVWLDQMRQISKDPVTEHLRDEQKMRKLTTWRIKTMGKKINKKLSDMSERKWTYDIGKIEGRRHNVTSSNRAGLENLSWARRPILSEPMESLQNEVELMNAMIEDAQSHEGGLDVRLKVWLQQMQDIAADANELLRNTDQIRRGFSNSMITRKIDIISRHIQWISRRKWLYDIGGIRGRRSIDASSSGLGSGSGRDRQMLVRPVFSVSDNQMMLWKAIFPRSGVLLQNFESIRRESSLLHALLKDVELSDKRVKAWMNQVSDVTDEIDVAISDYNEHIKSNWWLQIKDRPRIAKKMELILDKVRDVMERRIKFAIELNQKKEKSAIHADPKSTPHKLQLLNDDDSWALFTQSLIVPEGLVERSKKLVVKCGGFPQMIMELRERFTMLGSSTNEWMKVLDTPNLGQGPWTTAQEVVKGLPLSLKRCLLYLTQFPTDFEIPLRRLTLLWLAEGILHQWWDEQGLESPESVAERYLTELADRCLVQVTKRNLHGEVLKCRLPHVLRELLSSGYEKAESNYSKSSLSSSNIRHLVHFERKQDGTSGPFHSCITDLSASGISQYQSVIAFRSFDNREGNQSGVDLGKFLDRCISSRTFLLMRVLDLERVFRPVLPKALGALVLLKYLGLRWTYLEYLPSFMSKLLNLQTLDLKHTSISRLPDSIWKMGQLRHLFLDEYYCWEIWQFPCDVVNPLRNAIR